MFPSFKKLAFDIVTQADIQVIQADLDLIGGQVFTVCDSCGIPKPTKMFQVTNVEQCLVRLWNVYEVVESILHANYDISQILQGIKALVTLFPETLTDCGIQI